MQKIFQKYVARMLIVFMITVIFPTRTLAAGEDSIVTTAQEISENINIESEELEAKIVGEVKEKREKNVKYFFKDNGTYEAAIYNTPVHYLENGVWKDIDNSLVDEKGEDDSNILSNKENDYKVKIAKNSNAKKLVTIAKDSYELSWNIENPKEAPVVVQALDEEKLNADTEKEVLEDLEGNKVYKKKSQTEKEKIKKNSIENEKKKIIKNSSSSVKFTEIFEGVDISYDILSDNVKENIIINKPIENSTFKFNLYIKNLIPKLQKDKTIIFYDKNNTNKAVFMMKAPFMVDAKNQHSEDVEIALEQSKKGYTLTIIPNKEWLNHPDRAFPVILDPPVRTDLSITSIQDSFVGSNVAGNNYSNSISLGVGNGSGSGITRSFLKFQLPQELNKPGSVVVNAKLNLALYETNLESRQINVHKVLGDWQSSAITWNNKPEYYTHVEDYENVKGESGTWFDWDITTIVREWIKNGNNYGVMLKYDNESTGYNTFISSDYGNEVGRPQIIIQYVNNSGLESYWTYQSQSAGRAGTGYINSANGNLVFVHNDLSMSGNRMPVTINHVYNSNDRASSIGYGNGWRLNLNQRVTLKTFFNETWYEYIDEDGTLHYFSPSSESGVYKDESGIDLTLKKNTDGTFTIEDKENNKLIFRSDDGYLSKIQDSNGNTQVLTYDGTKLKSVTEKGPTNETDRTTEFISSDAGYLLEIIDPSKRKTIFGYEGSKLKKIIYPDKREVTYNYDSNNNLTDAINIDGYKINYGYSPNVPYLVNKVQEFGTDNSPGSNLNLVYGNNSTIFTQTVNEDPGIRRNIYQFNDYGNTISIKDNEDATGISYNFGRNLGTDKNKLTLESKLQKTIVNYLKNHNVEITNNSWSAGNDSASVGSAEFTTEHKYIGNQALKITKTNNTGGHFYKQAVTLQKGKTYTFSGYIRAKDISSASKKGAVLYVESGGQIIAQSNFIRGDSDWQKVEATFAIRQDAATAAVEVKAGIIEGTGTAYFDCFQLEEGEISNRYNLIENSDFDLDNGAGTYWNKANCDANDKVVNTDNKLAFQIKGSAALKKNVNQTIKVSGKKGDTFVLSGWAKGKSVPVTEEGERLFALDIGIKKNSGGYQYKVVTFNPDSSEWQYAADAILAEDDYSEVNVYGLYYGNLNTASFDNIQLYREEFAQSYSYDDKGNLASTQNLAAQKSEFKYDGNNNLVNAIDPKGSNFKYTYDGKHNIKTAASGENVIYSFDYDSNGNPVKAKIGDDSLFINSESTYTPSGNYISKLTDASGNEVNYTYYDENKGTLKNVQDGKGKLTTYTYDDTDRLKTVYKDADGQTVENSYEYEDDKIKSITHNGFNYKFEYDVFGNNNKVSVGDQNLITNTFDNLTGNLTNSTYGNGHITSIIYDNLGRITGRKYNGVEKFKYSYDAFGNLGKHEDLENGISYRYFYDMANRLTKVEDSNKNSTEYSFDINSNLNSATEKINNVPYATKYQYDRDNKLKDIYYDRYKVDNSKVQSFSLNNNLMGDKGVKPYDENAVFEKNDAYDTALAAYEGTTNLVKNNSSFENSTSSWVIGDMSSGTGKLRVVNDGFYGTKALELYDSDGLQDGSKTNTAAYQYVDLPAALTAPKTYTLSAYAKRIGDVNPEIYVDYIDADGKEQRSNQDPMAISEGKWVRISKSLTAPAGTKKIRVVVRAQVKDEFVVRFDGVQLEEKSFISAYTEGTLQPSKVLYDLGMNKASGTMSVWFNTSQNGTTRHIIGNQKDTAQLFNVYLDSSNGLNLSIIDNGTFRNVINIPSAIEKDKWNFVSVTWRMEGDTLKCKLYLNDKTIKEGTVVNPVDFTGAVTALGSSIKGTQQLNGRLQQFSFSKELLNDEEVASLYNAGRLSSTTSVSINYDELGRLKYKSVNPEGTSFKTSYQYETGAKSNSTTTKVSELDNNGQKIEYSYDKNGNIEVIAYKKEALFEATKIYYTYNELNELIREDNEVLNKTIKYSYDVGGNLIKKEEFAYTREVPETLVKTYEYKYEDTNWKDKLTSFYDGKVTKPITYDAIGNPLTYDGYTYTWEQGRQLKSMTKEGSSISFKYNDAGIRTEKTVDGVTTKYYLNGDQVAYEDNGTDKNYYTYDSDGSLVSMNLNGVEYYYIRNLQGDIIGLFDKNGTQVVSYTYDTWGKHDGKAELKDENGTIIQQGDIKGILASTVGVKNPYRYRGYRYETETGLYYLNSRYYNPEMGRFINMDSIGGKVGDLLSHNAFAYCQNNPVMNSDTSGQWFETFLDVVSVVSSFVNLMRNPSWKAATVLAYDCGAAVAPVVPASGTVKAAAKVSHALKISKKGSVAKSVASKGVAKSNTIKGGRFAAVDSIKGVDEVGHHMAQNAYNKTIGISRADGPALLMTKEDHSLTRTFAGRGRATMINDVGLTARQRLAKDLMDVRSQFGRKYNEGMIQMLDYAKTLPQYGK